MAAAARQGGSVCSGGGGSGAGTVRSNVVKDIFDVILLFINECECVFLEPKA